MIVKGDRVFSGIDFRGSYLTEASPAGEPGLLRYALNVL